MPKHVVALGTLADFTAPWETDAGEVEIDKDKLKRYIFNLSVDKAKAQDSRDDLLAEVEIEKTAVKEAKAAVKKAEKELADSDASGKIAELTAEVDAGKSAIKDLLRIKVGDEKGLTIKQSLRLQGDDEEALAKDAEDILETFGVKKEEPKDDEDNDEDDEDDDDDFVDANPLRRAPLVNSTDPKVGSGATGPRSEDDFAKIVAGIAKPVF